MDFKPHAAALAATIAHPGSHWWVPVRETPRHLLVEGWFISGEHGWTAVDGPADEKA
ncbi:hypothetical protein [Streptomyces sp. NPDC004830]